MVKLKLLAAALAGLLVSLCLSACNYIGTDPQTLIEPPRATGELYHIQTALKRYVNRSVTMKYPRSGDNRSAFVLADLDGDGEEEAVAFYSVAAENNVSPIHINIIDKQDGEWISVADQPTTATDVDKVAFADVDSDGCDELLVGLQMYSSTENQLNVYSFKNGKITQQMQEVYTEFVTCDLTGRGREELVILTLSTADKRAEARLYTLDGDVIVEEGSTQLDGSVSGYARVQAGTIGEGRSAVYIDANKASNAMITDVLFWDGSSLVNPFFDVSTGENPVTLRESTDTCRDINGDGQLDIPSLVPMPGSMLKTPSERMYLTVWKDFDGLRLTDIYKGDMNYKDGYSFAFPERWVGNITSVADPGNRMRSYKLWDPVNQMETDEILRIRVYSESEFAALDKEERREYIELDRRNSLVYVAQILTNKGEYAMNKREILDSFQLIG